MIEMLCNMQIGEQVVLSDWDVLRVVGGWLYSKTDYNHVAYDKDVGAQNITHSHSVFVPLTDEYREQCLELLLKSRRP